jgi:ABC-type Zn uptake system ZnuABC Zn-binding protein ZnuA
MLTAKTVNHTTKTLTQKDLNSVKKYVKLNNLKAYLLSDNNVNAFVESIMHTVLSSYTIVNHNDPNLLDVSLQYDANTMTLDLLDMCVRLFDYIAQPQAS